MTPSSTRESIAGQSLGRLRTSALRWLIGGATASAGLMVYAAERVHAPRVLLIGFTLWVLSPFGLLALADALSHRWDASFKARSALCRVMIVISVVSPVVYGVFAVGGDRPKTAPFVLVAPASWLAVAIGLAASAVRARRSPTAR
jgi:hypothetical protein